MGARGGGGGGDKSQSTAGNGKKKFVIKPFRSHCQMDAMQAKEIWSGLARAIDEIHNQDASKLSFEELYRNAYNLVLHKHGKWRVFSTHLLLSY
jgi:hypothetical protein